MYILELSLVSPILVKFGSADLHYKLSIYRGQI